MTRFSISNPGRGSSRTCTDPISTGRPTPALIEEMMRDLSREAPGLRRNRISSTNTAAAPHCRLEERSFTAPSLQVSGGSSDKVERSTPPCLVEEVNHYLAQEQHPVAPVRLPVLIVGRLERPVNEHRPPNDVFFGNESPIPAIETHAPVIAHRIVMIGRNYDV